MRTLEGVYKAVCLGVDNQGEVIRCQVPQIFNDETVTCFDVAGGVFPIEGDEGWVLFESGYPDHPIWLAASEGISSPDVTPGVGVIDVLAGVGIAVTPGQHPVVTNMGVLSVVAGQRITIDNANPQIPVVTATQQLPAGGTTDQVLAKNSATDYAYKWSGPMLPLAGGTMTGQIVTTGGEAIKIPAQAGYIGFWNGGTREGYIQGHANGMSVSADIGDLILGSASGRAFLPGSVNIGVPGNFPGYGGLNWSNGNYVIMTNGTDTFVTAPATGGQVTIRGGSNNAYQLNINSDGNHGLIGHLSHNGYNVTSIDTCEANGFNLYGTRSFYFASFGGGWYMTDGTYLRATNGKTIYTTGEIRGEGSFRTSANYMCTNAVDTDSGLYTWGDGVVGLVSNGLGTISCSGSTMNTYHVNTNDSYRVYSKGSYDGQWPNAAFIAQQSSGAAEQRTFISFHIPGVWAGGIGSTSGGGFGVWNNGSGAYEQLTGYLVNVSSKRFKQDIKKWQPQSVGAAAMSAANRLSLIDVVEFRPIMEQHLSVPTADGGGELHDCDVHQCDGTNEAPCAQVRDWMNPRLSVVIEDLATVLPEAVSLNGDGQPEGMRLDSMIGYLLAVCKEQQERIEVLEQNYQEAA